MTTGQFKHRPGDGGRDEPGRTFPSYGSFAGLTDGGGVRAARPFAGQLGADWAMYLSPFHYYIGGEPLKNGVQWADAGVLAATAVTLVAAGTLRFDRRDLNA